MLNLSRGRRGFLSLLTGLLLSISPLNTSEAGLIPWAYNAVFGYGPVYPYANPGWGYGGGWGAPYYGAPSYYSAPIQSFPSTSFYGGGFATYSGYSPGIADPCCNPCGTCDPCGCDPCGAGGCPGGICGTVGTPIRGDQSGPAPTEASPSDAGPPPSTFQRDPPIDDFNPAGGNSDNYNPRNAAPQTPRTGPPAGLYDNLRNNPNSGQGQNPGSGSSLDSGQNTDPPLNFGDALPPSRPAPAEPSGQGSSSLPFQAPLQREDRIELKPSSDPMDLDPRAEAPQTITRQRVVLPSEYESLAISPVKPKPSPHIKAGDAKVARR